MTVNASGMAINSSCVHAKPCWFLLGFDSICQFNRVLVCINRARIKDIFLW